MRLHRCAPTCYGTTHRWCVESCTDWCVIFTLLDAMAKEYEEGTWSGHKGEVHAGRPRFGVERLVPVTFKIAPSTLATIDQLAADSDETRSEAMRQVIDRGLRVPA